MKKRNSMFIWVCILATWVCTLGAEEVARKVAIGPARAPAPALAKAPVKAQAVVDLSRKIVAAEITRLTMSVQSKKRFMATARMTARAAATYIHAIGKMESTIALYNKILKLGRNDMLLVTATAIVHANLERNYTEQTQLQNAPRKYVAQNAPRLSKQEQALLGELKVLKGSQIKGIDGDKK